MNLNAFLSALSREEKIQFAELANTTAGHLQQLAGGWRLASWRMAIRLQHASQVMFPAEPDRQLTLPEIRPEIWGKQSDKQKTNGRKRRAC